MEVGRHQMDMRKLLPSLALLLFCLSAYGAGVDLRAFQLPSLTTNGGFVGSTTFQTNGTGVVALITTTNRVNIGTGSIPIDSEVYVSYNVTNPTSIFFDDFLVSGSQQILGFENRVRPTGSFTGNNSLSGYFENDMPPNSGTGGAFGANGAIGLTGIAALPVGSITNGDGIGLNGNATGPYSLQIGTAGYSLAANLAGQTNLGVFGSATLGGDQAVGVFGQIGARLAGGSGYPQFVSAAALFDNRDSGKPVILGRTNGVTVLNLDSLGNLSETNTLFAGGLSIGTLGATGTNWIIEEFPWIANDAFNGISNNTPKYAGQPGISFLAGQTPYLVFANSTSQGDWRGSLGLYGTLVVGDQTHMLTNGFENQMIANGCSLQLNPTNQQTFADNVLSLQNMNSKHYSAMRWLSAAKDGGDGAEKGAIGFGNTNALSYPGITYAEDYGDGQGFYFVGSGNFRFGKLPGSGGGTAGSFVIFTNTLAANSANGVVGNASFMMSGDGSGATNHGNMEIGGAINVKSTYTLGKASGSGTLLGNNIVVGDSGTANTGNGSFGRLTLNTKGDICSATLSFPNFGISQDSAGDWIFGWCSGTIGTNIFADATLREIYMTNLITHVSTLAASNGVTVGLYPASPLLTNIYYTNVTLNFPSTAAQSFSDLSVAIVNVKSNDIVTINPPALAQTNGIFSAWISNTFVFARFHNYASTAIDPAQGIFNMRLEQYK